MKKDKEQKSSDQQQDQQENNCDNKSHQQQKALSVQSNQQIYLSQINPIQQDSSQYHTIKTILENNGFSYSDSFSFDFCLKKVESLGEGIKYQIQYGHFRTYLHAVFTLYDFTPIKRQTIGLGKFGRILSFQYEGQLVAAKQFPLTTIIFDDIIREVFIVKLASALKIGARFKQLYGYDIIVLKDSCQYLTERCESANYSLIQQDQFQQTLSNRIISIVNILHSLRIIHGDIKPEHIMWSHQQKDLVIIDFGMSLFVKEKLGQKTLTNYFGTYSYSSKEMKKGFYLGTKIYADLFYNDLYAINKTLSEYIIIYRQNIEIQGANYINNIDSNRYQWRFVVQFFKFIFCLNKELIEKALQIAKKTEKLSQCFRLIMIQKIKKMVNQSAKISYEFLMKYYFKPKQVSQYEIKENNISQFEIIYKQILKNGQKLGNFNFNINFDQAFTLINNSDLCEYLQLKEGINNIFSFIFQQKSCSNDQLNNKKQIVKEIYFLKISRIPSIQISMNRQVLLFFQNYFYKQKALRKLKTIENIFRLTSEFRYIKKAQENIASVFLQNPQLWIKQFYQGIYDHVYINKNLRMSWQWLITNSQLKKNNTKKCDDLIKFCSDILLIIDRKNSSKYIKLPYKETQQQNSVIDEFIKLSQGQWRLQNQKNSLLKIRRFDETQICMMEQHLLEGVVTQKFTAKSNYFMNVLPSLDFILRDTVWTTVYLNKTFQIKKFDICMQEIFDQVFVGDLFEGIDIFVKFQLIFKNVIKTSKIMKELALKFLSSIQMKKILRQIQDDPYSIKQLIVHYVELTNFFLDIEQDSNQKNQLKTVLDSHFKEIQIFIQSSNKWWVSEGSQIILALQVSELYYTTKKTTFQHTPAYINQMLILAKKICSGYSCDFSIQKSQLQSNDLVLLSFVLGAISQSIQSSTNCCIDQIWQIFRSMGSDFILFRLLTSDQSLFLKVIRNLCQKRQFQECFDALQSYGKLVKVEIRLFNSSNISAFHLFAELLPENAILDLFIDKINKFSLQRIAQSPRISIIFIFLFQEKSFLFNQDQKVRYIKLISFGISLIQIRYQNFSWINGFLLRMHRFSIKFINHRKQRIHYRTQARVFHDQDLYHRLLVKKQKKCLKIKNLTGIVNKVKDFLLRKIGKEKINK